jgi:hypothetical protein
MSQAHRIGADGEDIARHHSVNAFLDWEWRAFPVAVLVAAGLLAIARGVSFWRVARRTAQDPARALQVALGFRFAILGACVEVFAAAWLWQVGWLLLLSLIVLGEEMLESAVAVAALRDGCRRGANGEAGQAAVTAARTGPATTSANLVNTPASA